jgi:hypothetical protein
MLNSFKTFHRVLLLFFVQGLENRFARHFIHDFYKLQSQLLTLFANSMTK